MCHHYFSLAAFTAFMSILSFRSTHEVCIALNKRHKVPLFPLFALYTDENPLYNTLSAGTTAPASGAGASFAGQVPWEKAPVTGGSYVTSPRTQLMLEMSTNPFLPPSFPMRRSQVRQPGLNGGWGWGGSIGLSFRQLLHWCCLAPHVPTVCRLVMLKVEWMPSLAPIVIFACFCSGRHRLSAPLRRDPSQ